MVNPNEVNNLIDSNTGTALPTNNFDVNANKQILQKCFSRFEQEWRIYQKIYWYYCGITDVNTNMSYNASGVFDDGVFNSFIDGEGIGNYNAVNDRFAGKVNTNFIKRIIKEEVSYSTGNPITYTSIKGDTKIIDALRYNEAHWNEDHETNLAKQMLTYSFAYELYYIDKDAKFCAKVISPRHGFAYIDDFGNTIFFLHIFRQKFDSKLYLDIYTDNEIIHCDEVFGEISRTTHPFGKVPIGIAKCSEEGWLDSIYHDLKSLQDAYETNVSDISTEITDGIRNAYLHLHNTSVKEEDLARMKRLGIIETKGDGVTAGFLVKNINDGFIQNTLNLLEDKMFFITSHINPNEKLPSNTSSLAIKARMMGLQTKCKLNEEALTNCIKTRHKMLFTYLNWKQGSNFDYLDIKSKFISNLPSDDLMTATIIGMLSGKVSDETLIAQLSFVDNPGNEAKKLDAQNKANSIGNALLNPPMDNVTAKIPMPSMNKTA